MQMRQTWRSCHGVAFACRYELENKNASGFVEEWKKVKPNAVGFAGNVAYNLYREKVWLFSCSVRVYITCILKQSCVIETCCQELVMKDSSNC